MSDYVRGWNAALTMAAATAESEGRDCDPYCCTPLARDVAEKIRQLVHGEAAKTFNDGVELCAATLERNPYLPHGVRLLAGVLRSLKER
jgi:hypothetical protein